MNYRTALGAALVVGGLVLLAFGMTEADSFASDVSEVFTGSPTDHSMRLLVGGAAMSAFGAVLALTGRKR